MNDANHSNDRIELGINDKIYELSAHDVEAFLVEEMKKAPKHIKAMLDTARGFLHMQATIKRQPFPKKSDPIVHLVHGLLTFLTEKSVGSERIHLDLKEVSADEAQD